MAVVEDTCIATVPPSGNMTLQESLLLCIPLSGGKARSVDARLCY